MDGGLVVEFAAAGIARVNFHKQGQDEEIESDKNLMLQSAQGFQPEVTTGFHTFAPRWVGAPLGPNARIDRNGPRRMISGERVIE